MSETELEEISETEEKYSVAFSMMAVMVIGLIVSMFIHELGHAIGLNLLGISSEFIFEIRVAGPALGVTASRRPTTTLEIVFVIAAGPGFAAIVFGLLGRFWKIECYIIAIFQACYTLFELMTWILGIQEAGELSILLWGVVMVIIPTAIMSDRILGWIESNSLNR
jgi:hypothetical protein